MQVLLQEFDEVEPSTPWQTIHESALQMFEEAGVKMPKLVYWNLRSSVSVPIERADTEGVVLLSGFSSGLLAAFLGGSIDTFNPGSQLEAILFDPVYQDLKLAEQDA
jgi:hypothetical protein